MHFDAVELVFRLAVARIGRDGAGLQASIFGLQARPHQDFAQFREGFDPRFRAPTIGCKDVDLQFANILQLHLPHDHGAGAGIRTAERAFPDAVVLHVGDVAFPDIQIDEIRFCRVRQGRMRKVLLEQVGDVLIVLAQDAVDIVAAVADVYIVIGLEDAKTRFRCRPGVGADEVLHQNPQVTQQNRGLLVEVRIDLYPPLLHQHPAEMPGGIESVACEIAFHGLALP